LVFRWRYAIYRSFYLLLRIPSNGAEIHFDLRERARKSFRAAMNTMLRSMFAARAFLIQLNGSGSIECHLPFHSERNGT